MTKYITLLCLFVCLGCSSTLQNAQTDNYKLTKKTFNIKKPKLVVGIVVDQMRYDYLTRFYNRYSNNGFKRLMNNGFTATNMHYNFVPTYTAPGHASIYTGTSPMNNGIIGNNWYDKVQKKSIYNASDDNYEPVGTINEEGKMSPRRLQTSTVTDELELHTQGNAKVIGISLKDRGAILPAGHAADAAYWYYGQDEGVFISSTFYMTDLPQWVKDFNASDSSSKYLKEWNTLYPINTYNASNPDLNIFERAPRGKDSPTFPYDLKALSDKNGKYDLLKSTPYGNSIVADMALAALKNENMGTDDVPDFLAISFSSTDYIGHQYGVSAVETEDTYLRLDIEIERILNALDSQVGEGNYTVFLTADHGAVEVPAYLESRRIPAGYFDERAFNVKLNNALKAKYKVDNIIEANSNDQLFFNHEVTKSNNLNEYEIASFIAQEIINYDSIHMAFTRESLTTTSLQHGIARLVQNGFHPKFSGDVVYVLDNSVIEYSRTGTTHGSPQSYDTHVPFLLYGNGVEPGTSAEHMEIIDIAPTISTILKISFPNCTTGNPIIKALKNQ